MTATLETQAAPPSPVHDSLDDDGFILLADLRPLVPLHPQHIRKLVKRGEFPTPVALGGRRTAFRRSDVRDWLRAQR
jgi:predicted DNA-binding transcriptional regulator AlpA